MNVVLLPMDDCKLEMTVTPLVGSPWFSCVCPECGMLDARMRTMALWTLYFVAGREVLYDP
jgi:hypothetical protein